MTYIIRTNKNIVITNNKKEALTVFENKGITKIKIISISYKR